MFAGVLKKMKTEYASPIQYYLCFEKDFLILNQFIGKEFFINHTGYQCLNCAENNEIFSQGFCRKCFFNIPQAGDWIVKPELSKAHLGIEDRNLEYEKQMQLQPHAVYLANSSGVKVGVTRYTQLPTRWIDQGATQALILAQVPNRYLAGIIEVELKKHIADKTNWRKMLTENPEKINLNEIKNQLRNYIPKEASEYFLEDANEVLLRFPIEVFPEKVTSLNLKKNSSYRGILKGIKGQYLIFEDGMVFNVRSHEGFEVEIKIDEK